MQSMRVVFILGFMSTTSWQESISGYSSIDRDAGVIRGVKILGLVSKNKRRYKESAAREAVPLYEKVKVFLDHVVESEGKRRVVRERWGRLVNVHFVEGEGLRGDLEYLKTHELTEQILESIERFGDSGLSHHASGDAKQHGDELVVSKIAQVASVDFVVDPATTKSLFEHVEEPPVMKRKLIEVFRENVKKPGVSNLLARLTEMKEVDSAVEIELAEQQDPLAVAVADAVRQIMESAPDLSASLGGCRSFFGQESNPELEAAKKTLQESAEKIAALEAEVATLKEESSHNAVVEACRKMLVEAKREVSDVRVNALVALQEDSRQLLVESWPEIEAGSVQRPGSSPGKLQAGLKESQGEAPKDFEDFKRRLKCG